MAQISGENQSILQKESLPQCSIQLNTYNLFHDSLDGSCPWFPFLDAVSPFLKGFIADP